MYTRGLGCPHIIAYKQNFKLLSLPLQLALAEVIPELHLLEQVASEEHIGTLAENLLEAMTDNDTCQAKVGSAGSSRLGV